MEPVPECQSPLFLHVDAADRDRVRLYFSAPPEAPTTRGFASILARGLGEQPADDILALYAGRVARWAVPHRVIILDSLPLGATGKVQKNMLRELYARPRAARRT